MDAPPSQSESESGSSVASLTEGGKPTVTERAARCVVTAGEDRARAGQSSERLLGAYAAPTLRPLTSRAPWSIGSMQVALNRRSVQVYGTPHPYWVSSPSGTPSKLLLALHGRGSSALEQARLSGFAQFAGEGRATVAFPQGTTPGRYRGYVWEYARDAPYLDAVIAALRQEYGIRGRSV